MPAPSSSLPPFGRYVLIYVPDRPWRDSEDQVGVFWRVAKRRRVRGLDLENNRKAGWQWEGFGPDSYWAHEAAWWEELPSVEHLLAPPGSRA